MVGVGGRRGCVSRGCEGRVAERVSHRGSGSIRYANYLII